MEAAQSDASDVARRLLLLTAMSHVQTSTAPLIEDSKQSSKNEFSVAEALGLTLHTNLSFSQYDKASVFCTAAVDLPTRSYKKRGFSVRPFPSHDKVMAEYKEVTSVVDSNAHQDIEHHHISLGLRSLLKQMIETYRHQEILDFNKLKQELLLRWGFDGTPICGDSFMIVSSLCFVGLRRMVLSREQHRFAILTKVNKEDLESFKRHFDAQIKAEIEDLRMNGITLPEGQFKVRVAYCVDLSASAKSTGLRSCHRCPFCNRSKNELGNFEGNYANLMRDLSKEDHALPSGTSIMDIVPDVLHMKIRYGTVKVF